MNKFVFFLLTLVILFFNFHKIGKFDHAEDPINAAQIETIAHGHNENAVPVGNAGNIDTDKKDTDNAVSTIPNAADVPDAADAPKIAEVSNVPAVTATPAAPVSSAATTLNAENRTVAELKLTIPVLNYHSINYDPGNIVVLSPEKFEEQMTYLFKEGYTTLRIQDFSDIFQGKKKAPSKAVLLTFDDGYTDNYDIAMPILKQFGFHATLFMTPGWVGKAGYLNWEQVKEMQLAGWDIQPHGMSHPRLPTLSKEKQIMEIEESRKWIEQELGGTADVFAYPYGEYNNHTLTILKENKFRYAFTIQQGRAAPSQNPLLLKRLFVNGEEELKMFIQKLVHWK